MAIWSYLDFWYLQGANIAKPLLGQFCYQLDIIKYKRQKMWLIITSYYYEKLCTCIWQSIKTFILFRLMSKTFFLTILLKNFGKLIMPLLGQIKSDIDILKVCVGLV